MREVEKWRVVPFARKYEVSSFGQVRNRKTLRILKPFTNKPGSYGYFIVRLYTVDGPIDKLVHRVVASIFELTGDGPEINHIDHDKKNNRPENLEWCSRIHNIREARKHHGSWAIKGASSNLARLTEKDVRYIRSEYAAGRKNQMELSREMEMTQAGISLIIRRKNWAHVV